MSHARKLGGRNIDAVSLQIQRIELRRLTKISACFKQNLALHPLIVIGKLRLQLGVWLLPTLQSVLLEQRRDSIDVQLVARQSGLDRGP